MAQPGERRRHAVSDVVRPHPGSSAAWAALGSLARDDVEAYACFRVGYHRGLDALRRRRVEGVGSGALGAPVQPRLPRVVSTASGPRPGRSASTTRRSDAPSSCASSTRRGARTGPASRPGGGRRPATVGRAIPAAVQLAVVSVLLLLGALARAGVRGPGADRAHRPRGSPPG